MSFLSLRPWRLDDVSSLLTVCASDDVTPYVGALQADDEAHRCIVRWQASQAASESAVFAIAVDDVPVGGVALQGIEHRNQSAQMTYWLAEFTRGLGLASRAAAAVAAYGFGELGLHRLELSHRVNHPKSRAVAVRAGFVAEGIERSKVLDDGERFDVETHARLATDPVPDIETLPISE